MRLFRFLSPSPSQDVAALLYGHAVAQARDPDFYAAGGVPDTLDGRFDMVCLHVFLLLHRLKRDGTAGGALGQRLFDRMFADLEMNMRELGVSDYGIGHRMKAMAAAFYGRIAAYEEGLAGGEAALRQALGRNLFGTAQADEATLDRMARYVAAVAAALDAQDSGSLAAGSVAFPHGQAEAAGHG
jgi:cytochrome b pre-mRNA-processing protein 3